MTTDWKVPVGSTHAVAMPGKIPQQASRPARPIAHVPEGPEEMLFGPIGSEAPAPALVPSWPNESAELSAA